MGMEERVGSGGKRGEWRKERGDGGKRGEMRKEKGVEEREEIRRK